MPKVVLNESNTVEVPEAASVAPLAVMISVMRVYLSIVAFLNVDSFQ